MANTIVQLKRTSVSGRAANTTTLTNPGELALNMTDGILYSTNGTVVFEIGANNTNAQITANLTVRSIIANGILGTAGQFLTSNGSTVYWSTGGGGGGSPGGADTQLQFNDSGSFNGTSGFTFNKTTNNVTIANTLTVRAISANGSVGTAGQILTSNGTVSYWATGGGGSTNPGGADTQIQFNDGGVFNGIDGFTVNKTTNNVTIANTLTVAAISANGSVGGLNQSLRSNGTVSYWASLAKTVEIDFGLEAVKEKLFTISDAQATNSSIIIMSDSHANATGRSIDENEMDGLILSAYATTGQITVYARAIPGPVNGKYKINYIIS